MSAGDQRERRYAGKSSEEREAERRERLKEATFELVAEKGYAHTTVSEICSVAGVSTRHFYQQHENKEAAFTDLYSAIIATSGQAAVASLQSTEGQPMTTRIAKAFWAYLGPQISDTRTARIVFVEIVGISADFEARRLSFRENLVQLVEAVTSPAVAAGELPERDYRFWTIALAGAATSVGHDWAVRPDAGSLEDIRVALTRMATVMLLGQNDPE